MPLTAYGSPEDKIDLVLKNVSISMREGSEEAPLFHVGNFKKLTLENFTVTNTKAPCLVRTWTDDAVELTNINVPINEEDMVKKAEVAFSARPI